MLFPAGPLLRDDWAEKLNPNKTGTWNRLFISGLENLKQHANKAEKSDGGRAKGRLEQRAQGETKGCCRENVSEPPASNCQAGNKTRAGWKLWTSEWHQGEHKRFLWRVPTPQCHSGTKHCQQAHQHPPKIAQCHACTFRNSGPSEHEKPCKRMPTGCK